MNIKLGYKIRQLRAERGITQEALAREIGVSFQSVSKWENDTTTPDIALLPDIAKYFAVTLDDLFSLTEDDQITRIDAMLRDDFVITDENFRWAERYLKGILSETAHANEARVRLIELYRHRASRSLQLARRYAWEGIRTDENEVRFHRMFFNICKDRGDIDLLIDNYEKAALDRNPSEHAIKVIIEACLETRQTQKAQKWISRLDIGVERALYEGDVLLADGDEKTAKDTWLSAEKYAHAYQDYLHIANRFDRVRDFDTAIRLYLKSRDARPTKGALDYAYALAFIYEKKGCIPKAIEAWQTILATLESDWGVSSGESADWPRREIERLRKQ